MKFAAPFLLAVALLTGPVKAQDLTVYAAASLGGALDEIAEAWAARTDGTLTLVYAGSSALARQITAGAPADVVILASPDWMDELERQGAIRAGSRRALLGNRLVLIGGWHDTAPLDLTVAGSLLERLGRGRLALALTQAVPAGIYAREALETLGQWESVAPRVVESDNVRSALSLVALRAASMGIVYATDAATEPRVSIIADLPEDSHSPIIYPAAVAQSAAEGAADLLDFLESPIARAIWSGHGFRLPEAG